MNIDAETFSLDINANFELTALKNAAEHGRRVYLTEFHLGLLPSVIKIKVLNMPETFRTAF